MTNKRYVYLDHSATTPTDPQVIEAMLPYFGEVYGNASSSHSFGRTAEKAIEDARASVANILHCKPSEIIFTGGGSESDNLAIRGIALAARDHFNKGNHIITTPVEHSAVTNTCKQLSEFMGFSHTMLPVNHLAEINPNDLGSDITDQTMLVTIIYANNEVGTISPLQQLAEVARNKGVIFHTDAVQGGGQLNLDVKQLGVDLLSLSAHKFYGPKGVGVLYMREGLELLPSNTGGSHEQGRRPGTHNTPGIVGLAKALQIAYDNLDEHITHYRKMRDMLVDGILNTVADVELTGHPSNRLPSHASLIFAGVDSSTLLMHLDTKGVAASGGSACKTGNPEPSSILLAMGYTPEQAIGSLRLTVGRSTTEEDIDYAIAAVKKSVENIRKLNISFNRQ